MCVEKIGEPGDEASKHIALILPKEEKRVSSMLHVYTLYIVTNQVKEHPAFISDHYSHLHNTSYRSFTATSITISVL